MNSADSITTTAKVPRILVVDDMPDNLFLMNGLFEDRYKVVLAASGAEALKVVMSDDPPDMVLLDIMMPDMDGYEVLRRIRQNPPTANIPVIFLTALVSSQDERLGLDLGAIDYLTKPVDADQVIRRVEAHVRETIRARRLELLSEKLARYLIPDSWNRLFHGEDLASIRFEEKPVTLLYAETTLLPNFGEHERDAFQAEAEWLAVRYRGQLDAFVWGAAVAFFDKPQSAVRMAMELQRSAIRLHLRIGVHTGTAVVATFDADGQTRRSVLGPQCAMAAKVAGAAATGSISISPETYALVQGDLQEEEDGGLIAEAFRDSELGRASVSASRTNGDLSSFASLN